MRHIMVDIETLGNDSNSIITSLGAIAFDPFTGEEFGVFDENITIESCVEVGLTVTGSTIRWWMEQNDEARMRIAEPENPKALSQVLGEFAVFIAEHKAAAGSDKMDFKIWGNSPRFDEGLIEDAYIACKLPKAWNHRDEMCLRTLNAMRPEHRKKVDENREGVYHDPADDCRAQIAYLVPIWKEFMSK